MILDEQTLATLFTHKVLPTFKYLTPVTQPKGYVLGGQPGAGKSQLLKHAAQEQQGNIAVLNADEFRPLHPQFKAIAQQFGLEAANHTAAFVGAMVQQALQYGVEQRFNLTIEGTFRTAETPLATLQILKAAGYQTEVLLSTCPKEVSWTSTLNRYTEMKREGLSPRFTPKASHDQTVEQLAQNVAQVTAQADQVRIFSREGLLYQGHDPTKAAQQVEQELTRPLTSAEYQAAKESYEELLKEVQGQARDSLVKEQAAFLVNQ
ncbi:zeta toxin family protein [Thiofilum flexile]|uniref:zeta toxin family protein n=1 Tax=Thiofilum flexile TaxID=125627 RepID=UPI0003624B22|nr:zeta toxin family protein [Thiofilum flexile]